MTDSVVAKPTKQAPNLTCLMIVVNTKTLLPAQTSANCTYPTLLSKHALKSIRSNPIPVNPKPGQYLFPIFRIVIFFIGGELLSIFRIVIFAIGGDLLSVFRMVNFFIGGDLLSIFLSIGFMLGEFFISPPMKESGNRPE